MVGDVVKVVTVRKIQLTVKTLWLMVTGAPGGSFTEYDSVRSVEVRQAVEAFKAMTRVTRRVVRILDRSAASSSVHSIYKN